MWWACPRWPQPDDFKPERAQVLSHLMQPAAKQSHSSSQQMKKKKMPKRVAAGKATAEKTRQAPEAQETVVPESDDTRNVTQHYSMARCHQHFRFNGENLEQTWRDKKIFHQ